MAPGWPGYISDGKSDFDGTRVISVYPGTVRSCCGLGATWSEKYPDVVQIDTIFYGDYRAIIGLELNADGRTIRGVPTTNPTKFSSPGNIRRSEKTFSIDRKDFDAIVSAKQLGARLITGGGVMEGDLMRDAITGSAIEGFRSFSKRLP